jgi:hypothetical protein
MSEKSNEGPVSVWVLDKTAWKECQVLMKRAGRSLNKEIEGFVHELTDQLKGNVQEASVDSGQDVGEGQNAEPNRSGVMEEKLILIESFCLLLGRTSINCDGGTLDLNPLVRFTKDAGDDEFRKITERFLIIQDGLGRGEQARNLVSFLQDQRRAKVVEDKAELSTAPAIEEQKAIEVPEKPMDEKERIGLDGPAPENSEPEAVKPDEPFDIDHFVQMLEQNRGKAKG